MRTAQELNSLALRTRRIGMKMDILQLIFLLLLMDGKIKKLR